MILITGATGLVGSHLLYDLLKRDYVVRAAYRNPNKLSQVKKIFSYYGCDADSLFKRIEWFQADILDIYSLLEAMEGVEEVYHCAAIVSFDPRKHKELIRNNIEGTANMVTAALEKKIKKFCHVSSIAALGRSETQGTISEDTHWLSAKNKSAYSVSKYKSENEVWRGISEGLNAIIVNPSIILCPGYWNHGSSALFNKVSKGMVFYTKGVNGFVDVRDITKAMILLMESDITNQRFILNSENLNYQHLLSLMAKALGVKAPYIHAGPHMSAVVWRLAKIYSMLSGKAPFITKETANTANKKYYFTNDKIKKSLNFEFIPVEKSVKSYASLLLEDMNNRKK